MHFLRKLSQSVVRALVMPPTDVCIVAAGRTPIGCFQGDLSSLSATELCSVCIKGLLDKNKIDISSINEAFIGNVLSANLGQAPAKQACLKAGLPETLPCTTINKVCASGMKATMLGCQSIICGTNDVVLVGGMESMSNVPHYIPKSRSGHRMGHFECADGMIKDGLWDPYEDKHMGSFAEKCAKDHDFTREAQDEYAIRSFERAIAAVEDFKTEIIPIEIKDRKGKSIRVDKDEGTGKFQKEKLRNLKPAFQTDGTVTAGNSSQISDGAAVIILARRSKAAEMGWTVLASIEGMADASQHPSLFTTTPAAAIDRLLKSSGLTLDQIGLFEINEAFAVVALANGKILGLDESKVNIRGGAVALGHPIGCSGARIVVTLINALRDRRLEYGIAAVCNGGGGASAVLIKNESAL